MGFSLYNSCFFNLFSNSSFSYLDQILSYPYPYTPFINGKLMYSFQGTHKSQFPKMYPYCSPGPHIFIHVCSKYCYSVKCMSVEKPLFR